MGHVANFSYFWGKDMIIFPLGLITVRTTAGLPEISGGEGLVENDSNTEEVEAEWWQRTELGGG